MTKLSDRATQLYLSAEGQRQAAQQVGAALVRLCDAQDVAAAELARELPTVIAGNVLYLRVGFGGAIYTPEEGLGEA